MRTGEYRNRPGFFAVCIEDGDYPASLEARKLYVVPDDQAASPTAPRHRCAFSATKARHPKRRATKLVI
jgi:hypothetical protein